MALSIVILAAGQGTRMRSALPKVLHCLGSKPLLQHAIDTARKLNPSSIHVVVGFGGEQVRETISADNVHWVEQKEQLGTGHAVDQAMPSVDGENTLLVLYGDVPLIAAETLSALIEKADQGVLSVLTAELENPQGYGRMIRDDTGQLIGIVEQKDANKEQLAIREVNTGFLAAPANKLKGWLGSLDNQNAQGEYYLTDVISMASKDGTQVSGIICPDHKQTLGVNDRSQLAYLERCYQRQQADYVMQNGITLVDPARFDLRGELRSGQDCHIDINVIIEGSVNIGDNVKIGPNCLIKNTNISDGVEILANCVIEEAHIGASSRIGPFARIRPETVLSERVHIGNFVEIKKSEVAEGSKVNHLSYIGDTKMGSGVNVGAGTITCNYDGAYKHLTEIGNNVFVGSDTQLIAPVKIGDGATIGAGSTITSDVPANELAVSRSPQKSRKGWKRPVKSLKT